MLGAIGKFLLFRVLGARVMLALALLGFVRRLLGGRRSEPTTSPTPPSRTGSSASVYQPSQGSSQIVHREPR
jgi:hypothetical protein